MEGATPAQRYNSRESAANNEIPVEEHFMKAIVTTQYGPPDVLQFKEIATPTPADDEVLIKVYAASVNPLDLYGMRGGPWLVRLMTGRLKPKHKVLGCDIAGRVEAVGRHVKQFQPGDEVFGVRGFAGGGFAEYVCAIEDKLALKPANISFEDAAARVFVIRDGSSEAKRFWSMARLAVWVRSRSRLPNRSGLKSLPSAAPGMWTRRDRSAQTMSLITLDEISRKAGSVTI
jgi:hypothetical protein